MILSNNTRAKIYDRDRYIDLYRNHNDAVVYFGDIRSKDYGIYLTDIQIANSPKRDLSFVSVPGCNGDLIVDNNRWKNLDIVYSFAIPTGFAKSFDAFKAALLTLNGYVQLSDSIYPDYFRVAIVKEPIKPTVMRLNRTGVFDVTFHCKPQRFLKSGTNPREITEPTNWHNRYGFEAKPLITVYGSGAGTLTIGDTTVEIKNMTDQLTLDCERQTAYRQIGDGAPENMNSNIYAPSFPVLGKGDIAIGWTGGVTKVDIIPRWWTI